MSNPDENLVPEGIDEILNDPALWSEPPGEIEPSLLRAIAGSDLPKPAETSRRRRWWPAYAAAALVAVVALFVVLTPDDDSPVPSAVFALSGIGGEGQAEVGAAEAGWWIRVTLPELDPAPDDGFYEGWVSDGDQVVSVGTFHMRDGDTAVLWSGVPMKEYPELLITLQMLGAGTAPSTDVVATGHLAG